MAQKELEKERQIQAEASKLKDTYGEKSTIELEGPSMLGCEGVFYKCPEILGPNMALPRSEMQKRIKHISTVYLELKAMISFYQRVGLKQKRLMNRNSGYTQLLQLSQTHN